MFEKKMQASTACTCHCMQGQRSADSPLKRGQVCLLSILLQAGLGVQVWTYQWFVSLQLYYDEAHYFYRAFDDVVSCISP